MVELRPREDFPGTATAGTKARGRDELGLDLSHGNSKVRRLSADGWTEPGYVKSSVFCFIL